MKPFRLFTTPIETTPTLIEASAGTGKTFTITGLFLRLLLEGHVQQVRHILVVTFTNAATSELIERIRAKLNHALRVFRGDVLDKDLQPLVEQFGSKGHHILRQACLEIEELSIFTIHGFCKRMLETNAFESGMSFSPSFLEHYQDILQEAARDFWRHTFLAGSPLLASLAVVNKWQASDWASITKNLKMHPGDSLLQEVPNLEQALASTTTGFDQLILYWEPDVLLPFIGRLNYKKNTFPTKVGLTQMLSHLQALNATSPNPLTLATILELAKGFPNSWVMKTELKKPDVQDLLTHPFFHACQQFSETVSTTELSLKKTFLEQVEQRYRKLKKRSQQLDYDDLLEQLHECIHHPRMGKRIRKRIASQYHAALIDEFQDTDHLQFNIFQNLFPNHPLYFIGDPKQAIYSFRGADLHAYLAAKNVTGHQYTLTTNWRSHHNLVEAVNRLFLTKEKPFEIEAMPYPAVGASGKADKHAISDNRQALQLWLLPEEKLSVADQTRLIHQQIAREIEELKSSAKIGNRAFVWSDFAVLVSKNKQAQALLEFFQETGIPARMSEGGDIFQTQEMFHLFLFLRCVLTPDKNHHLQTAMTTMLWGGRAADLQQLTSKEQAYQQARMLMEELKQIWHRNGFLAMIFSCFHRLDTQARILSEAQGRIKLTNLRHCAELIQQSQQMANLTPEGTLRWLQREMARDHHEGLDTALRNPGHGQGVQIMTVHKSKGLEFEVVFCPFLWQGQPQRIKSHQKFHDDSGHMIYDLEAKYIREHDARAHGETTSEDLRKFYVALTRAKQRCYLLWHFTALTPPTAMDTFFERHYQPLRSWVASESNLVGLETISADKHGSTKNLKERELKPDLKPARKFKASPTQLTPWRMTSFSALTSGSHSSKAHRYDPDRSNKELPGTGMFAFAKGPRAGNCLHEILEHLNFQDLASSETQTLIDSTLQRYDLSEPQDHQIPLNPQLEVETMLTATLGSALPNTSFSLNQLPEKQLLKEWPFFLPLDQFKPTPIRDIFERFKIEKAGKPYVPTFSNWEQQQHKDGYLNGIIDLCFTYEDKWFLLDWKSNDLGHQPQDYEQDPLWDAMCDHHYVLQYYLYSLALHRFLKVRLADYHYTTHFGGVYYAFLRGIDGKSSRGWFVDKPKREVLEALDRLCKGEALT